MLPETSANTTQESRFKSSCCESLALPRNELLLYMFHQCCQVSSAMSTEARNIFEATTTFCLRSLSSGKLKLRRENYLPYPCHVRFLMCEVLFLKHTFIAWIVK